MEINKIMVRDDYRIDAFLKKVCKKLVIGEVNIDDFVVTKSLKAISDYKPKGDSNEINVPHVKLALKLMERDPGSAPKAGDRMPYVFIEDKRDFSKPKSRRSKNYERCEDPEYVKQHNLNLDMIYYLTQINSPIKQLFSLFGDGSEKILEQIMKEYVNKRLGLQDIRNFFKPIKSSEIDVDEYINSYEEEIEK
jgi:DNA polymerase delta subunit 1